MSKYGVLDKSYNKGRKTKRSLRYRLNRRAKEVIDYINKYYHKTPENIIELGTADGLMLSIIKNSFPEAKCLGIEYSSELVKSNADSRISVIQGDVNFLPMPDDFFDIAVATAILEHLPDPVQMLKEAKRVLKPNGLLILTSPDPFWEKVATMVGHLREEQHFNLFNLKELATLFDQTGYEIMEQKKFMLSPVGMPLEIPVESVIRNIGFNFLFANQLIIGRKI